MHRKKSKTKNKTNKMLHFQTLILAYLSFYDAFKVSEE